MSRVTRHLRVGFVTVLLLLLSFIPLQAAASQTTTETAAAAPFAPSVIITEFQTNGGTASQEFVELHNTTDASISLGDGKTTADHWKLQFFGSSVIKDGLPVWTTTPSNTVILKGTIPARGYLVFSTTGYMPANVEVASDQQYGTASSNFMTDSGGALKLMQVTSGQSVVQNQLVWQDPAKKPVGEILPAPAKGLSQQRHPFDDDTYFDDHGLLATFGGESAISPYEAWVAPVPIEVIPEETEIAPGTDTTEPDPVVTPTTDTNAGLAAPIITELLPNPASPAKDETDEFIELYNPNNTVFNLKGYSIQVGLTTLKEYTFAVDTFLPAEGYQAFYSSETKLALTNTGSKVRLLDPAGVVIDETLPYAAAAEGLVWAFDNSAWQWSSSITANQANLISVVAAAAPKTATAKAAAPKTTAKKTTAAKAKGTTKTKAAKVAKPKKAKKAAKPKTVAVAQTTEKPPRAPIHAGVLVAVVSVAVLYAAYEYRHDIANRFYQLRGNRTPRAFARQ